MKLTLSRVLGIVPPDVRDIESLREKMPDTMPVDPPNHTEQIEALDTLGVKAASCTAAAICLVAKLTEG